MSSTEELSMAYAEHNAGNSKCVVSNTHTDAIYTVSLSMTKGEPLTLTELKQLKVTERPVFEIYLPKKVQNFTQKLNGKELIRDDKYEIIVSDDGLAHRIPIKFVSNLKNTQVKEKGEACPECVLTSEDVALKGTPEGSSFPTASPALGFPGVQPGWDSVAKVEPLAVGKEVLAPGGWVPGLVLKQRAIHKLIIDRMGKDHEGEYTFRANGARSGATVAIGGSHPISLLLSEIYNYAYYSALGSQMVADGLSDPSAAQKDASVPESRQDSPVTEESVLAFAAHSISVKTRHTACIKVLFKANSMPKVTWFKDGIEMTEEEKAVMEKASDVLLTIKTCVSEDSGAIMLNLKNYFGYDPLNNSPPCQSGQLLTLQTKPPQGKAEFLNTWGKCKMRQKAPKGNGGKQVNHFVIKRRMAGEFKIGVVESNYTIFATEEVEEWKAQFRIHAINSEESQRRVSQLEIVNVRKDVTITWNFLAQDGGSPVHGYIIEKRKKGSNLCVLITREPLQEPPGLLKVVDFSNSRISLAWQEPDQGDVLSGYILEIELRTSRNEKYKIPISSTTYTVGGLQERQMLLLNLSCELSWCERNCGVTRRNSSNAIFR
ncbi:LOW QUALITY PROTEIN: immunoglobulin superfamily member 22 [Aegotheles albertisi]